MEDQETNLLQTRKGCRIEQMVGRWLRRSRDNSARISTGDGVTGGQNQSPSSLKQTILIQKDLLLHNYGFDISRIPPLTVTAVTTGSPAEGKLLPGDQILRINNENVENISVEQAADMVRESEDSVTVTVLRYTSSPKSSFLTAEKRARLRSNPVKVRFAEEVIVNGHCQGNSLLFMPNVLKVYLENGQTKAFKFEKKTTVKDIIMTLKEKLSINIIEHFALALEEQYNISKLYLLHEDELIEQVVQKRESHDYRCLFRVCFVPKDPFDLLQEDPVAFEYLYLQSCSDVLQERFAVEMKCSVALRLAALHIQERIYTCGQPQKISFKYIEKDWGIDNFLSPTLLRNMRSKDIKKAISFHIKRNQCILEPRQKKPISAAQVRLNYLKVLGDLKTYGGKIFNATLMLQDRESYVALLVGAKYGISQIINNKLNIMTTLAEFSNISRIELTQESEKVSMVKVYLQDVKPLSLLLESNNAKDIACLISGYCKLFVDSGATIFLWPGNNQRHRVSAEEGYESRACSDSEESSEVDSSLEPASGLHFLKYDSIKPLHEEVEKEEEEIEDVHGLNQDGEKKDSNGGERGCCDEENNDTDSISEASDSANTEGQGYKISWSSDSIDALEEDDLETCSSSRPEFFQFYTPSLKDMAIEDQGVFTDREELESKENGRRGSDPLLCLLQLPSSREDTVMDVKESSSRFPRDAEGREENELHAFSIAYQLLEHNRMEYYSLCSNVSPASSVERNIPSSPESNSGKDLEVEVGVKKSICHLGLNDEVEALILDPPPGFGDSSSEEEFFDATDRFTPTLTSPGLKSVSNKEESAFQYPGNEALYNLPDSNVLMQKAIKENKKQRDSKKTTKVLRKRRSFLQTDYTSQVTFPVSPSNSLESMDHVCCYEKESHFSIDSHSPTVSSLKDTEGEPSLLETKPLIQNKSTVKTKGKTHSPNLMEMEPDTMETKSVTDSVVSSISAIRFRTNHGGEEKGQNDNPGPNSNDDAENTLIWNTLEHSGRASPSEIYLQLYNTSINSQLNPCMAAVDSNDSSLMSCIKEEHILEGFEPKIKTTFKNIFKNGIQDDYLNKHNASKSYPNPTSRQSLYVAKSEDEPIPCLYSIVEIDSTQTEGNMDSFVLPREKNSTQLFPQKTQKSFDISNATDLLFDFSGISGLLTHFSMNSLREETTPMILSDQNVPFCDEEEHLLVRNTDLGVVCGNSPNMERCCSTGIDTFLSSSLNSLQTTLVPLELCYAENEEERDSGAFLLNSEKGHSEHSVSTKSYQSETQSSREILTNSLHQGFDMNHDKSSRDNEDHALYSPEKNIQENMNKPVIPEIRNAGNCSCQLSYVSCFRGVDTEAEDETVAFGETISSLPTTIPPAAENVLSVERNRFNLTNSISESIVFLEHCDALNHLRSIIHDTPTGFGKLQDSVLDLQKILEQFKNNGEIHSQDKCAARFSEDKSVLCSVSRKLMSTCQKVLRSEQSSVEMYQAVEETFLNLMQMTEVCLQFSSCVRCSRRQIDVETNLQDLICTFHQFVQAAKKASERESRDLHSKLLSRQCTALTAAVFCLTQQYRTLISL
ncbi:FERM and PDZ domain-containing protein 1 isoform X1 [Ascaphus truei]|uniref:FERM and PDZ domain-containing protein 1 isoform X1 n=2 Tax=Ascaphus truei TaxID=8439 RepID=UPI003F5920F9